MVVEYVYLPVLVIGYVRLSVRQKSAVAGMRTTESTGADDTTVASRVNSLPAGTRAGAVWVSTVPKSRDTGGMVYSAMRSPRVLS